MTSCAAGGNNVLIGGDGNDGLMGRAGADTLDGGAGFDFVDYGNLITDVVVDLPNEANNTTKRAGDVTSVDRGHLAVRQRSL